LQGNFGEFIRDRAVKDFLVDAKEIEGGAHDLAAFALEYLLIGDLGPMDQTVCVRGRRISRRAVWRSR
jgi:hypothetical protein